MRKLAILLALVMILVMGSSSALAVSEVTWIQGQVEGAAAVDQLVKLYTEKNPDVKITADVNGTNLYEVMKSMFSSGDIPEIFMTGGYKEMMTYSDYLTDLTEQPFVSQIAEAALACVTTPDGAIVGLPVTMSGEGICYNKAIFEEYDIEVPTTFTELVAVCEKLKANGVTPFVNQFKDDWLVGQFVGCAGYATIPNTAEFTDAMMNREATQAGNEQMLRSFKLLDLMVEYGMEDPLSYGMNEACTAFALGEAAMIFEGDWIWGTVKGIDPEMQVGMFGAIVSDDPAENRICADVNGCWHVGKGSENAEIAIDILNWMVTDEQAKEVLLNTYNVVPVIKGWEYPATNPLSADAYSAISADNVFTWPWPTWPNDGYRLECGKLYQEYLMGNMTPDQVLEAMDAAWQELIS